MRMEIRSDESKHLFSFPTQSAVLPNVHTDEPDQETIFLILQMYTLPEIFSHLQYQDYNRSSEH